MAENTELETRLCAPADRERQAALYETCFGKQGGSGLPVLQWRYDQNPHGGAVSFLTSDGDGRDLSGYACSPRRVIPMGEESLAGTVGQTGDVMTHPDARGRGVFSDLDRAAMKETGKRGWQLVFGLPNSKSEKLFVEKLDWDSVGRLKPWTFVLAWDAGAKAERMKAGRLAALGVPWSYWRGTMRRGALRNQAWEKVNTMRIPRFDAEVDDIAKEVERRFAFMVRRDHDYLNWRFIDAPSGLFRAHGVYEPSGKLRGYAVIQLPRPGETVGYLVDLLAVDEEAFAAAMDAALGHLRKAGASVARAWAIEGSWWESRLVYSGFRPPKKEDFKIVIAYIHDREHPLGVAAKDPASWYFTDGDRDDETVS